MTQKGFSLIELSIVLTVMAITTGTLLTIAGNKEKRDRIAQTQQRMEQIKRAMADYVYENGRLPCPDSGGDALNAAQFGAVDSSSVSGIAKRTCNDTYWGTSGNIIAGTVPVRALELPNDVGFDGWGRRIVYVVDNNFISSIADWTTPVCDGVGTINCFTYTPSGGISVGIVANDTSITTTAAYVLISYGANGYGAYPANGSTTRITTASMNADEQENAHVDSTGATTSFDAQFVQKEPTAAFDDIVSYSEKWQIIADMGTIPSFSNCQMAENVVKNLSGTNLTCTGASSVTICESFATEINSLCAGLYK
ncbi:MAG: hypothetical protein K0R63_1799 [Rickettsiales bacterium]|jgi:prepilin-type N-terminal cleavage/methylation domain-containing protein|nr:hypothetical protein [Rickettsiales bacterium]